MRVRRAGMLTVLAMVVWALPANGESCETNQPCMIDGMCMADGTCQGTPVNGGSCEVVQADANCKLPTGTCVNGRCKAGSAAAGTSCGSGCGTCQLAFPGVDSTSCTPITGQAGKPCELGLGPCFPGVCTVSGGQFTFCNVTYKSCPDIDHNPCTSDFCNILTGQCDHADVPPCVPICETCNPATGQCQPANEGVACEGSTECTAQGHCESVDIVGSGTRGLCLRGAGTGPSPTPNPTAEPSGSPAPTATPLPSGLCIGDCDVSGEVTINEIIILVNIALGSQHVADCPHGLPADARDEDVSVAVIIQSVNNVLTNCPVVT